MSTPMPIAGLALDLLPQRSGNDEILQRLRAAAVANEDTADKSFLPVDQNANVNFHRLQYESDRATLSADDQRNVERARWLLSKIAPGEVAELAAAGVRLIPLALRYPMLRASHSEPEHPDAIAVSLIEPIELAELIIVEHARQKLRFFAAGAAIVVTPEPAVRSPFRYEPCTAWQVLEDVYAYATVATAFDTLFAKFPASQRGKRRTVMWRSCVRSAISLLRSSGHYGTGTAVLLDALATDNDERLSRYGDREPTLTVWAEGVIDDLLASGAGGQRGPAWYLMV